jgi:hypothetical protein
VITSGNFGQWEKDMHTIAKFAALAGCLIFACATYALAQDHRPSSEGRDSSRFAQIVALDECDPTTFNAALGPDFCRNVTLGAFTTLNDLLAKAAAGTPDPGWDFEPDTFTEVAHFGGGFRPRLNAPGEDVVPECAGGFSNVAVARTRILQASTLQINQLEEGEHLFQCCIHPWMRVTVVVK